MRGPLIVTFAVLLSGCASHSPNDSGRTSVVVAASSCWHECRPSPPRHDGERLLESIRPGMTLAQIERAVPHSAMSTFAVYEHGGEWYHMTISDDFSIQIRVAHPRAGAAPGQSVINHSPGLYNRKTGELTSREWRLW
jgi:hypothetical protein